MPGFVVSPENLQRVGCLAFVPDLLRRFGVSPADVLAMAGLNSHALDSPEANIPYAVVGRLLKVAATQTRCPYFGLEVGKQIRTGSLGLVGELMRNAPTLGAALLDFATHQHRNAHGSVVYVRSDKHQAFFGYAVYQPTVPGNNQICDCVAMGGFNLIRELAGSGHVPAIEVLLSRSAPDDQTPYLDAFGVTLRFDAEQTAILMPRRLLDRVITAADPALRKALEKRVAALWNVGDLDILTHLRRTLRVALIGGEASADEISAKLGMSRRTLHRRLDDHGLQFQEVLDETRCEFAQQLLANTRLGIAEIATIIGYTDPSVLTRGFTRWVGVPPSEWRVNFADSHLPAKTYR